MTTTTHHAFCIPADHPALPGHFPGRPIVPGVVLLAEVAHAVARNLDGARVSGFASVKFLAPLAPGQHSEITLSDQGAGRAGFAVTHDGRVLATGSLRYERA